MRKFWIWIQLLFKKEYATYKMFKLKDCYPNELAINPQGMDIYKDQYIFQGEDLGSGKQLLNIINIDKKEVIKKIHLNLPSCHMNNINIGYKLNRTDRFPLLYISECVGEHKCYVIRLENDLSNYSLIQTICFNSNNHYNKCKGAFDWFLSEGFIYTFGIDSDGVMEIIKFPYPQVNPDIVTYSDKHILDSFKIDNCYVYQGTKVIDGKLYALFGLDTKEYPTSLKVVDLRRRAIEKSINIKKFGELESLGKYKDGIIVVSCAYNPTYTFIKLNNNE